VKSFTHAIIGCGRVAPNHVDGFRALDGYEIAYACDRQLDRAQSFASEHRIPSASAHVGDVLGDSRLTSVSVVVDHAQHADLVERALMAGKHVLVEKPLALSVSDADRLIALSAARGRVLSVVSQHRFDPVVLAVRDWLAEGLLGQLLYVQVSLEAGREPAYYTESYWRGTWSGEGGSALINQGYHCLDVTQFLCGPLAVRAAVASTKVLKAVIATEETLSALMTAGDVPVTLNVTVGSSTIWRTRLEFVGELGAVCFDIDHPGKVHRASGRPELLLRAEGLQQPAAQAPPAGTSYYGISHRQQIADFASAVREGTPLASPPASAAQMVRLLTDLYAATRLEIQVTN
jgi:UDP-N-acetyl-2-amino-2-deoxyglucuronate dehydrogenase